MRRRMSALSILLFSRSARRPSTCMGTPSVRLVSVLFTCRWFSSAPRRWSISSRWSWPVWRILISRSATCCRPWRCMARTRANSDRSMPGGAAMRSSISSGVMTTSPAGVRSCRFGRGSREPWRRSLRAFRATASRGPIARRTRRAGFRRDRRRRRGPAAWGGTCFGPVYNDNTVSGWPAPSDRLNWRATLCTARVVLGDNSQWDNGLGGDEDFACGVARRRPSERCRGGHGFPSGRRGRH